METTPISLAEVINTTFDDAQARAASGDFLDISEERDAGTAGTDSAPLRIFDVPPENDKCSFKYFEDGARCVVDALTVKAGDSREHVHLSQMVAAVCRFEGGEYSPVKTSRELGVSVPEHLFRDEESVNKLRDRLPEINGFKPVVVKGEPGDLDFNRLMSKMEFELVRKMSEGGGLSGRALLLKDGPLPGGKTLGDWQYIVGVCKSFRESLKNDSVEGLVVKLKENQRSNVFRVNGKSYWFLRLRTGLPEMPVKETVRCEICGELDGEPDIVNDISAAILRLKFPVCFGYDDRWRNHLYPVSVTERYCKSQYISPEMFRKKFGL